MSVGVSALMKRCELLGLYFQTKFFSNHSQLFSWWSTLRCYVKTLRKDQRIINWKSLDRISTCQLKCMWPRLSPHILRHSEVRSLLFYICWNISSVTQITGFDSLIIRAGRYQEQGLVSDCPMCHTHSHTGTGTPDPGRGRSSNLNLPYGHRINCPWPYLNFNAMMLRPFFHCLVSPHPMVGTLWPGPAPGRLVTLPRPSGGDHCVAPHCWWPLPGQT